MKKYDEIRIEGLECFGRHGVNPEEKAEGQLFYVDAVLYTNTRNAALKDDLTLTTNYSAVADYISHGMKAESHDLIETAAEQLAEGILLNFPLLSKVDLAIKKPHAPLKHNFTSVSVKICRAWHRVYVATGSNLGDSRAIITAAAASIGAHPLIKDFKASELVSSKPYGVTEQPDFLNGALCFWTLLSPHELLAYLQGLETAAGRVRDDEKNVRWGARTLDLDILMYDDMILDDERLTLPHPDMHRRDFVLAPLVSLNPRLRHPVLARNMAELLQDLGERHIK